MAPSPVFNHQAFAYRIAFELQKIFDDCKGKVNFKAIFERFKGYETL